MLVSELNALFIHIPKTGGTSIELLLLDHLSLPSNEVYNRNCLKKYRKYYLDGRQHYGLGQFGSINLNKLYIFSFVRNPYTRFYSSYIYSKDRFKSNMTLSEYVDFALRQKRYLFGADIKGHLIPQIKYIGRTEYFNYIGYMESFDDDLKSICYQLGIAYKKKHIFKQKKQKNYLQELMPFVDKITDYYYDDFELFGYKKYDFNNLKSRKRIETKKKAKIEENLSCLFNYTIYQKLMISLRYLLMRLI